MKKLVLASILVLALGAIFSSCKSHEKCPAYSKAKTEVSAKKSV